MADTGAGSDVFALTDEQIIGVEPEGQDAELDGSTAETKRDSSVATLPRNDGAQTGGEKERLTPEGVSYKPEAVSHRDGKTEEAPQWLAERMKDPWHGEEAKELWDGKQRAEKEAAAYREVFATPEDARALKEIYPGGANEAKAAAERARTLDEIDAAFYRGDAAARAQLARQMMQQDPAAFREMVEAGVRLLGEASRQGSGKEQSASQDAVSTPRSLLSGPQETRPSGRDDRLTQGAAQTDGASAQGGAAVAPEIVSGYRAFEKAANAELEKSVGGAIARMMEQALPNLKMIGANGREGAQGAAPLQERLGSAVREEIEAELKNDGQLGEQVGKILAGRRFDDAARSQVVRLIDARAKQLVPGAVRRVVSSWTQATLGAREKGQGRNPVEARHEELAGTQRRATTAAPRKDNERQGSSRNENASTARRDAGASRGRRVDYGKISDEEILGM
jgi:hypothetical protein